MSLCCPTYFVTGTGQRRRSISLMPIFQSLGAAKAPALPAFHALSGADNTAASQEKENWHAGKSSTELMKM